jgi:hypothetical protein
MKKHGIQKKPNAQRQSSTAISPTLPASAGHVRPGGGASAPENGALLRWLVPLGIAGVVALVLALLMIDFRDTEASVPTKKPSAGIHRENDLAALLKRLKPKKKPRPLEVFTPQTKEEALLEQFVKLRQANNKSAFDLLGPAPVFDENVAVSQKEAERLQTDFFLRGDLEFTEIRRGEPDGEGDQVPAPGHYTLVTKGSISAPRMRVGNDTEASQEHATNLGLIVEVRDGKIHGIRHSLP